MPIIPPLSNIPLLVADASDLVLGALLQPTWGLYLNGTPVIQPAAFAGLLGAAAIPAISSIASIASLVGVTNILPTTASTVDFEYRQDFPISNYPQEQGAFQSYNKVTLPFDVKMKLACGGSASRRQGFISTCLAISQSFALFDVVTPELVFSSVNCTHIDFRRGAKQGNTLIQIDLWFEQVPVVNATSFSNTQQPGEAGQQSIGNVQSQTPNPVVNNAYVAAQVT